MDNFSIDITADKADTLKEVMQIVFRQNAPGEKASHWVEMTVPAESEWLGVSPNRKAFVLLWHEEGVGCHPFPSKLDAAGAYEAVRRWLSEAEYGDKPDQDGSNKKGFRAYCDFWGHFESLRYAIVGIVPAWAMYGK